MINLDGFGLFLVMLALYALALLALAGFALFWMTRRGWRRWAGAGLLATLLVYGFGPTLLQDYRGDRLGARMEQASFWPEDLSFAGAHILMIGTDATYCSALCDALFTRAGVASLHQLHFAGQQLPDDFTVQALRDPATQVTRIGAEIVDSANSYTQGSAAALPEVVNWIIVDDAGGDYARANAAGMVIAPSDAAKIAHALHIYRVDGGRLDSPLALTPVARMVTGWRIDIPPFLPAVRRGRYSNDTTPFSDALEAWICGPVTPSTPWEDRCPYLF